MINIKIGSTERQFESIDRIEESWINQQINGLKREGHPICVRVRINDEPINLVLATPDCQGAGGGGGARPPSPDEQRIFDLWKQMNLNGTNIQGGNVIAFFKQARKIIR